MQCSLGSLAEGIGAQLRGDAAVQVSAMATLEHAGPGQVSFYANRRYRKHLRKTRASAVIIAPEDAADCPVAALVTENPYLGYARAALLLNPSVATPTGVQPGASVASSARVHPRAGIGPFAVIGEHAEVGEGAYVGPHCVVGDRARIGRGTRLVAQVTLCAGVRMGARCLVHPGAVIGADGFGIANDGGVWVKVPQLGGVWIGDDVEVGANTTIDRGALEDTILCDGVKLDNQVQVGHNVYIGAHTAVAGCVGIAGSARIGQRCTIGGAAAIAGHLEIVDDVHLTAGSAVANSIKAPGVYSSGLPVQENHLWRRMVVRLRQLEALWQRVRRLEERLR